MTLHDFIKKYIARNTMIRLWKEIDIGTYLMLTDDVVMEWEALSIKELADVEVACITDIICEENREAINIVVDTKFDTEDITKLFCDYRKHRENEEMNGTNMER